MKNMYDVFLKLKENYKDYEIIIDDKHEFITIKFDEVEIFCDDSLLDFNYKYSGPHVHLDDDNYDEIYEKIVSFINHCDKFINKIKRDYLFVFILMFGMALFFIVILICMLFE